MHKMSCDLADVDRSGADVGGHVAHQGYPWGRLRHTTELHSCTQQTGPTRKTFTIIISWRTLF